MAPSRAAYLAGWAALDAAAADPGAGGHPLAMADIPWPAPPGREADVGALLLAGLPAADHKRALAAELLRWHPDKFRARLQHRLVEAERGAVLERVNAVSQRVQELKRSLADASAAASQP